mmetsp:Transcript_66125/g.186852  ORF Transcript_66125/g.186852 Transcript_66125/m.186852 type:complete len:266 (-) Transcript_66125:180-977(-)
MFSMEDPCFVYEAEAALVSPQAAAKAGVRPPVHVATKKNQAEMPLDMTGIWWIRWTNWTANPDGWNNIPWNRVTYGIYNALKLEELMSFEGATVNSTHFPLTLSSPTGEAYHWGFTNSLAGRIAMNFAAKSNPNAPLNISFENKTHAQLGGFGGRAYMTMLDEDRWLRSTEVKGDRYGVPSYQLTRIVYEDGSTSKYFSAFLDHMGSTKIRVFSNNNQCERLSGVAPRISKSCEPIAKECAAPNAAHLNNDDEEDKRGGSRSFTL